MMTFLLNNWRSIVSSLGTLAIAIWLHNWDVQRLDVNHVKDLQEQSLTLNAQCDERQKLTQKVSNDYQNKLTDLNSQLSRFKRLLNTKPGMPPAGAAVGHDGQTGTEHAGSDGRDAWLEYGGQCEAIRLQLGACQDFVDRVWDR